MVGDRLRRALGRWAMIAGAALLTLGTSPARAADVCLTGDAPTLMTAIRAAPPRTILPDIDMIPVDDLSWITLAGPTITPAAGEILTFRLFVAPVAWTGRTFGTGPVERHPVVVARGTDDSYRIEFVAPPAQTANPLQFRQLRSVLVVGCAGNRIATWGLRPFLFAPRAPAELLALLFVLAVYVAAGTIVYLKRRAVERDADPERLAPYRIASPKAWTFWRCLNPVAMTADAFDNGSLPKFQILFFLLLISYGLAYLSIWTGRLSDLSTSIVYLLGLPALGGLGAQAAATTRSRLSADSWAWLVSRRILPINDTGSDVGPRVSDLIMSDRELDLSKLQALTFSFVVAFSLLAAGPNGFSKFNIPDALLQILGLSQLVFIGGRFVRPTTLGDVDDMIAELRRREAALRRALQIGVDVDETGALPKSVAPDTGVPPVTPPAQTLAEARQRAPLAASRYDDTAHQVAVMLEAITQHHVDATTLFDPVARWNAAH